MMKNVMMMKWVNNNTDYNPIYQATADVWWWHIISIKKWNVYRNMWGLDTWWVARYSQSWDFTYSFNSVNTEWLWFSQRDVMFNDDWTRMFSSHTLVQSSVWEIITNPYWVTHLWVAIQWPYKPLWTQSLFWDNWNKFYFTNLSWETHQYNLYVPYKPYSWPWAWLEWTFVRQVPSIWYIQFSEDWTKVYTIESNNLIEYNLSIPWDLSTVSFNRDMPLWSWFSFNWRFEIYWWWLRVASTGDVIYIYSI